MKVNIKKPPKNYNKEQKIKVKIEDHDVWNFDLTLAEIIVPGLELLKKKKYGAPKVDLEDVPEHLHPTEEEMKENDNGNIDKNWFNRWYWILDEMIWAMSELQQKKKVEGVEDFDLNDWLKYEERIQNGCRLFGKYYTCLWS